MAHKGPKQTKKNKKNKKKQPKTQTKEAAVTKPAPVQDRSYSPTQIYSLAF